MWLFIDQNRFVQSSMTFFASRDSFVHTSMWLCSGERFQNVILAKEVYDVLLQIYHPGRNHEKLNHQWHQSWAYRPVGQPKTALRSIVDDKSLGLLWRLTSAKAAWALIALFWRVCPNPAIKRDTYRDGSRSWRIWCRSLLTQVATKKEVQWSVIQWYAIAGRSKA